MKMLLTTLAVSLSTLTFAECKPGSECCVKCILEGRIPPKNHRYRTFAKALGLIRDRNLQVFVETAANRYEAVNCLSDGCFTLILGDWIKRNKGQLYTIKFDEGAIHNVKNALGDDAQFVKLIRGDSIDVLGKFEQKIDFLYLDSMDFDPKNPKLSQQHALKEVQAAYPWLSQRSIVMVDDCKQGSCGKSELVVEFLVAHGWKILAKDSQVILSQE